MSVCACVRPSDLGAEGVLCRCVRVSVLQTMVLKAYCVGVRVSHLQTLVLKAYCVGVCVYLTSSDLDAEGVLCRCVRVSDLFRP